MNDKTRLQIQFEALMQHVAGIPGCEVREASAGEGSARIIHSVDGFEYLISLHQLQNAKPAEHTAESLGLTAEQFEEAKHIMNVEGGDLKTISDRFKSPAAAEQQSMVFAPVQQPTSLDHLESAIDRDAHPAPLELEHKTRESDSYFDRDDDKHVAQNGSD